MDDIVISPLLYYNFGVCCVCVCPSVCLQRVLCMRCVRGPWTFADTIPTYLTLLLSKSPLSNKGRLVGCLIKGFFGTVWLDLASMSMTHSTKIKTAAGQRCLRLEVTALYDLTSTSKGGNTSFEKKY